MEKVQIKDAIFRLFTQTCFCTFVLYTHITLWLLLSLVLLSSALCLCVETRNIAARSNKIYFTHGAGNVVYCPQWPGCAGPS